MPDRWEPRPIERRLAREAAEPNGDGRPKRNLDFIEVHVPRRRDDLRERALRELKRRGVREFRGDPVAALGWKDDA